MRDKKELLKKANKILNDLVAKKDVKNKQKIKGERR